MCSYIYLYVGNLFIDKIYLYILFLCMYMWVIKGGEEMEGYLKKRKFLMERKVIYLGIV